MRPSLTILAASAAGLFTLFTSRPAHALGPVDLEIAGKVGYATNDAEELGFGGRAGVSIFGIYGGFNLVDYLGKSGSGLHTLTYGGEVGYGYKIAFLTLRPLVGFGNASITVPGSVSIGGASVTSNSFYVQPEGLVQFNFGVLIFGVEAGALIPTASGSQASFTLDGQVGLKF